MCNSFHLKEYKEIIENTSKKTVNIAKNMYLKHSTNNCYICEGNVIRCVVEVEFKL